MECICLDDIAMVEKDLALSDEDDDPPATPVDHWPELPPPGQRPSTCVTKRPAEDSFDSTPSDRMLPVAKTPKSAPAAVSIVPPVTSPSTPYRPSLQLPAFAPREFYVKLAFSGNPSTDVKLRWLSAVNKAFQLQRDRAEVKMAAITSRFVYISRQRTDILERVQGGEFLALQLLPQDSPERSRKYPSYILTRYPVDVDPKLAERYPGVYSARRFIQNGAPINRIVVVWNLNEAPPPTISFDFLPCLPACEVRKLANDQPVCYRCWNYGHISRYCSSSPKCAWCADTHDTRSCPHRDEASRPSASTSTSEPPPRPPY